jgi:beta-lactamase regulating signal transducer with metallopeptidase domain
MTRVAIETLNAWGSAWAGAMGRSLVESTALLVVVGLAWVLLRRRASSAFLHGLFLLVLIKAAVPVALPYTLSVSLPWPLSGVVQERSLVPTQRPLPPSLERITPDNLVSEVRAIPDELPSSLPATDLKPIVASGPRPSLSAWLMLAWAVVVASLLARFVIAHVQMAGRLRGARLIDPDELPVDPVRLAALAERWRPVPIVETYCVSAPAVWGLVRPRLLVPPGLTETLPQEQLTWAFLHELVHVRRGDTWVVLFQRLIQIVFFFNPAVWVANRVADVLREFACDDASLALADVERHDCGAGFLAIAERVCRTRTTPTPITLGLFGSSALIHKRLERILDDSRPLSPRLSWRAATLLGVMALAVLPSVRAQAPGPAQFKTARQVAPQTTVDPKTRTPELKAGSTIGGVVKDSAGQPIAGVLVHVIFKGKGGDADIREHSHKTDAEGRWQCNEVPADLSKTSFRLEQPASAKVAPDSAPPAFKDLDKERYRRAIADIMRTDAELIDAESSLAVLKGALQTKDEDFFPLIEEEFMNDPEVVGLIGEINEIQNQLKHAKERAKQPRDPAIIALHKHRRNLMDRYENLWKNKYEAILKRLGDESGATPLAVRKFRLKVATLKKKKEMQTKNLEQLQLKNKK